MQELEDYHRGAATAHREHGKISLSMPEIPQPVLAASATKGWLVTPDPDPLDIRDHGNGSGPEDAPGSASALDPGSDPGPPNGSGPGPGGGF
jgi:hypothetical protein